MACIGSMAQDRVYTLADWKGLRADTLLQLNVSEYKLDYNHPLPYADMQKEWITTDFKTFRHLGHFGEGETTREGFSEQKHGAVTHITEEEAQRLENYWNKK